MLRVEGGFNMQRYHYEATTQVAFVFVGLLADAMQDEGWELVNTVPLGFVPVQRTVQRPDQQPEMMPVVSMIFRTEIVANQESMPTLPSWEIREGKVVFLKDGKDNTVRFPGGKGAKGK